VVGTQQRLDVLGVEMLGARGEPDEVDEDDADETALFSPRDGALRHRLAAREAEPRDRRVVLVAGRANGHDSSLRGEDA
jgi:hypothetical protein